MQVMVLNSSYTFLSATRWIWVYAICWTTVS